MKKYNFVKFAMATLVAASALFISATSVNACIVLSFKEPTMPKSLLKKD